MSIKLFNTITKKLEDFKPIYEDRISIYVCGPTVYSPPHVGNARPMIVFDTLVRMLKNFYPEVIYVRNITDIDDKIINAAKERGQSIKIITEEATKAFHADMKALNVIPPTYEPKASEYISNMCDIISDLIKQDHAYIDENNDVLFNVENFSDYGTFKNISSLQSGHRHLHGDSADRNTSKQSELDFVLWKNVEDEDSVKYDFAWETPEAMKKEEFADKKLMGRPGWHIECTAMSTSLLGKKFDIHGGGQDLTFPHHENERAQTCAYTKEDDCANYWMHNGLIQQPDGKMSKSLGNIIYVNEVASKFTSLSIRFFMLQTHYRHPLVWDTKQLEISHNKLTKIFKTLWLEAKNTQEEKCDEALAALASDLNTPLAITILDKHINEKQFGKALFVLKVLGLIYETQDLQEFFQSWLQRKELTQEQKDLIKQRAAARESKDYGKSDEIRDILLKDNIVLEDLAERTIWYCS